MAFRTYGTTPTDTVSHSAASTMHSITLPSCDVGDCLMMIWATVGSSFCNINAIEGWNYRGGQDHNNLGTRHTFGIHTHYCDGREGELPLSVTLDNSAKMIARVIKINDFHKDDSVTSEIAYSSVTEALTETPDHPSLTPSWGSADTLWIAACFYLDDDATVDTYPTNYVNGSYLTGGSGTDLSNGIYTAFRENATATENPGTGDLSEVERCFSFTIAIRPYVTHTVNAASYLVKNLDDDTLYYNSGNTTVRTIYSLTKLMTMAVVRDNKTEAELQSETRTIVSDDITTGTGNNLLANDVVGLDDLVTNALLPSSNTSANALAAQIGAELLGGTPTHAQAMDDFYDEMDTLSTTIGITGPVGGWTDAAGWPTTDSIDCDDIHEIMKEVMDDSFIVAEMKKPADTITIDRGGDTDINLDHTLQGSGFYNDSANRALFGKTGSGSGNYNVAMIWDTPSGDRVSIILLHATSEDNRAADVRHFLKQLVDNYSSLLTPGAGSITGVTPSTFDDGQTGIVISVSNVTTTGATVEINGQAQTITGTTGNSITFTAVRGAGKTLGDVTLSVIEA